MSIMSSTDDQNTTEHDNRHSFYEQPAYTALDTSDASIILSYYSAEPYGSHRQLAEGITNTNSNYCIISKDQSYYFCKICDEMIAEGT